MRHVLAAIAVLVAVPGCRLFSDGVACNPDNPATCPANTTCVAGVCTAGVDGPPLGPFCGDGHADPGEACDDGNGDNSDGCHVDCTLPTCGDGFADPGEQCDDGNAIDNDGCTACVLDASNAPVCGDGVVNGTEQCDFAATPNTCNTDCTTGVCGDGKIDGDEECDDHNSVDGDGCTACALDGGGASAPSCGDGVVNGSEQCDFVLTPGTCNLDCTNSVCGDGKRGPDEECDVIGAPVAVANLDGALQDSTFETGVGSVLLPTLGWATLAGAAQVFDNGPPANHGVLTDGDPLGLANYEVEYATGEAALANTTYTLRFDVGSISGGNGGGKARFLAHLGTSHGGVFTALGKKSATVVNVGNIASGGVASSSVELVVVTGAVVSGDPLAVRLAQTFNDGTNSSFSFDNVTLFREDRCTDQCVFAPAPFCGDGQVTAGEDCDGGNGCTSSCRFAPVCTSALVEGFCEVDVAGALNNRVPRLVDLDGDGLNDLVTTESEAQRLFVQMQTEPGLWTAPTTISTTLSGRIMETGDVDNDGDVDVILGGNNDNALQVLRSDGRGGLSVEAPFGTNIDDTREFEVADFDGDGDVDLRVGGLNTDAIVLVRNAGDGTFAVDASTLAGDPSASNGMVAVAVADFDHDGDLDTVTGNFFSGNISTFLCDATGDCANGVSSAVTAGVVNVGAVAAGDVNGDGNADIVAADVDPASNSLSVLFGNGDGTFAPAFALSPVNGASAITVRDLDGDGRADIVVLGTGDGVISIFRNIGGSSFSTTQLPCPGGSEVSVGDADGDGREDLVCTRPAAAATRMFFAR